MRVKRSVLTVASVLTAGLAASALLAPAAGATTGDGNCTSTELCVFNDYGHDKNKGYYDLDFPALANFHDRHYFNDGAYIDPAGRTERSGDAYRTAPGDAAPTGATWDDSASRTEKELLTGKLTAYQGHRVPKDGCYGVAGRALTEKAQPPHVFDEQGMTITRVADASPGGLIGSYVSVIRQALSYRMVKDSRIERAVSQWSACMKSKGYDYRSPTQTATTDMGCKKRVRYLDVVVAVESAYENRYIKEHPARMKEFLRLRDGRRHNAEAVLS